MSAADNIRNNIRKLLAESGRSAREVSLAISKRRGTSNDSLVKNILSSKSDQPRRETVEYIAYELGTTATALENDVGIDDALFHVIDLEDGRKATVQNPSILKKIGRNEAPLTVTAMIGARGNRLFDLIRIGDNLFLQPHSENGKPVRISIEPGTYSGLAISGSERDTMRITGVVRLVEVRYNTDLDYILDQ